jgi:hypothetical protein
VRIVVDPTAPGGVTLEEPDDLKALEATVPRTSTVSAARDALTSAGAGTLEVAGGTLEGAHVHVAQAWLRASAEAAGVAPGWVEGFRAMLAFAGSKGWVDESAGTVRAHVVLV